MVGKNIRNYIQYFLCFHYAHFLNRICLACIVVILCVFVSLICICYTLCVFIVSYVYLLYLMCICCTVMCICHTYVYLLYYVCTDILTLDDGLLTRSQYPEGPATGQLDTGFSWFPFVYKQMLRWFPSFQVATTCLSCSPPDLNFLVTFFYICVHVK